MNPLDSWWFEFWESVATIGIILLILGCVLEGVGHFKTFRRDESAKKHRIEKLGWFILVVGLSMEFVGDHKAKRYADAENARLTEQAGSANERAALAQLQLARFTNNDPINLPIFKVSADVELYLVPEDGNTPMPLRMDFVGVMHIGSALALVCRSAEAGMGGHGHLSYSSTFWPVNVLEIPEIRKWKKTALEFGETLNTFSLQIDSCSVTNVGVKFGTAIVMINGRHFKSFDIVPNRINDKGVCSLRSSNSVSLLFNPSPASTNAPAEVRKLK